MGEAGGDYDQRRELDPRDFSRRTLLANERTYLAWWRTGLTTIAVALAAARVVPDLSNTSVRWPYTVLGVLFALIGVVCVLYAEQRRRAVEEEVRRGSFASPDPRLTLALSVLAGLAGLGVVVLLVLDG